MLYAEVLSDQTESDITIVASEVLVTGTLYTDQGISIKGFPLVIEGGSRQFIITTTWEGTFQVPKISPGNYTIRLANSPSPDFSFSVNKPEWYSGFLDIFEEAEQQENIFDSYDIDVEFHKIGGIKHGKLQVNLEPL